MRLRFYCFSFVFLALVISTKAQNIVADTFVVATINAETLTYNEYQYFKNKHRALVIKYFRDNCNLKYGSSFWATECKGETPLELLNKKSLNDAIFIKAQQIIAKNDGLVNDISYSTFLVNLDKENKRRLLAKEQNKVIFGPVQYTEKVYYEYIFSNLVIKLKKSLAKNKFDLSAPILKEKYEISKDSLFKRGYYSTASIIKVEMKELVENNEELLNLLEAKINKGVPTKKLLKNKKLNKYFSLSHQEIVVNDSAYRGENEDDFLALVNKQINLLEIGKTDRVNYLKGDYLFITLESKRNQGYRSFEECERVVYDSQLDELYTQYVKNWINSANIVTNELNKR